MKHRLRFFAALPLVLALGNVSNAGFRCGGCSDPCKPRHVMSCAPVTSYSPVCGPTLAQPSPSSCGYVGADGSYAGNGYYAPSACTGVVVAPTTVSMPAVQAGFAPVALTPSPQILCEQITGYRTVMESTFVIETQYVNATEVRQETRQRVRQVTKTVPVTYEDYRIKTVTVPRTDTKTVEYSVLVPEQSTKSVTVNVTVPEWTDVTETYKVKVPTISDVQETYQVKVPKLRDETFTYTVYVPQTESVTKMHTVTNAVPVVKTRTVQRTIPKYTTQTVTKDYGHWETVVEEVAGSSYSVSGVTSDVGCGTVSSAVVGGGCGSSMFATQASACQPVATRGVCRPRVRCGRPSVRSCSVGCGCNAVGQYSTVNQGCSPCNETVQSSGTSDFCNSVTSVSTVSAPVTTTRRVWVPNVVTEEVQVATNEVVSEEMAYTVYEQQSTEVPYECTYLVYRPETRTGTKKVVDYVNEDRTRTRKVVSYVDEERTRTRKVVNYKTEAKEEVYPVVSYRTEKRTKDVTFTINEVQQIVEPFTATRMETVVEDVIEDYVVNVPVPVTREVQVQVCKMVPKLVPYTFNPCATSGVMSNESAGDSTGCGCGVQATAPVLLQQNGLHGGAMHTGLPGCGCGCGN